MGSEGYELQQCPECWAVYEADTSGLFVCGGQDIWHDPVVMWPKQWVTQGGVI